MEDILREAFKLGQQWVKDMDDGKEPLSFNDWYKSNKINELEKENIILKESVNEVIDLLNSDYGVPNIEWIKNRLLNSVT